MIRTALLTEKDLKSRVSLCVFFLPWLDKVEPLQQQIRGKSTIQRCFNNAGSKANNGSPAGAACLVCLVPRSRGNGIATRSYDMPGKKKWKKKTSNEQHREKLGGGD